MKSIIFFFVLSLLLYGVFIYLFDNLPLIDPEKVKLLEEELGIITQNDFVKYMEDLRATGLLSKVWFRNNFLIMLSVFVLMIFSTLATLHLVIDKLFFKTIKQNPNVKKALRRSLLLTICISGLGVFKVFGLLEWYTSALLIALTVGTEVLVFMNERQDLNLKKEENVA